MPGALEAVAAVATLFAKSGIAEHVNARLAERRAQEARIAKTISELPDPRPPKKGSHNG